MDKADRGISGRPERPDVGLCPSPPRSRERLGDEAIYEHGAHPRDGSSICQGADQLSNNRVAILNLRKTIYTIFFCSVERCTIFGGSFKSVGAKLHSLYPDGKFPSVSALEKQRDQLESERRTLYQKYSQLKKMSSDIDKASQTIKEYLESVRSVPDVSRKKKDELE